MWWYKSIFYIIITLIIQGCGYQFSSTSHNPFPTNITSFYIQKVKNPTTDPTLPLTVKHIFIEELSKRLPDIHICSKENAKGLIILDITTYSKQTELENINKQTIKSNICISINAFFYNSKNKKLIWNSKIIQGCESSSGELTTQNISNIQQKIIRDVMEKLAIQLKNNF